MEKNLYIDASHPNETRIVLKSNNSIEEYEFEDKNNLLNPFRDKLTISVIIVNVDICRRCFLFDPVFNGFCFSFNSSHLLN